MATPTTNPVPSSDPNDLVFNAEKLDTVVNSSALQYQDRLGVMRRTVAGAVASISATNPRGAWVTATAYQPRDVVSNSGTWYISLDAHTSGATFAGDQTAHWRVYQGVISSDLADKASTTKGAGSVGYDSDLVYPAGTVGAKLNSFVTPEDEQFGAIGDGTTNDTAAIQAFFTYLAANGGIGLLGRKTYKITTQITLTTPARGFAVYGAGQESVIALRAASNVSAFGFTTPQDIVLEAFKIDVGYSVTTFGNHGFSFRNADRVTCRSLWVTDYRGSAGLTFVDVDDTNGDCHFINCHADGGGTGQNGFLHEGMLRSSIQNCTVVNLDPSGSPCCGLQIKNKSKDCWIDGGFASGCKSGVALGGDGATFGDGPFRTWVRGVITKDCLDGATIGKSTDCTVEIYANQTASPAPGSLVGYALNVGGANVNLSCVVRVKGVQSGRTCVLVRSSDTSILVPYVNGIGSKLLEMSAGVNRCRVFVQDIADSGVTNIFDYVTDNSGTSTNEITFARDLPGGGLANSNFIKLQVPSKPQNWLAFNGATDQFNMRINGTDRLALGTTALRPAIDNSLDMGAASFRIKQYYGVSSTISTSDAREKTDIAPIDDAVLDAWEAVDLSQFRWVDAVKEKGTMARLHFGVIAQQVRDAFKSRGLDPFKFGVLCYDEWQDQWTEELNDLGQPTGRKLLTLAAGNRYGVRYDQALILEAALMRRERKRMAGGGSGRLAGGPGPWRPDK